MSETAIRQQVAAKAEAVERAVVDEIIRALSGLRFGSVEVVVHDGRVTLIERKEKLRLI